MTVSIKMFSASWCGPCKMMKPIVLEFGKEEGIEVALYDVDEQTSDVQEYNVRGVPTVVIMKDGIEADRIVGTAAKSKLKEKVDSLLS